MPTRPRRLNLLLIVHADHEQNCSTSTGANGGVEPGQLVCIDFGRISAPGGRCTAAPTRACVQMLEQIRRDGGDVKSTSTWPRIRQQLPLMGLATVYKNFDPRRRSSGPCHKVLAKQPVRDPIFDIACSSKRWP